MYTKLINKILSNKGSIYCVLILLSLNALYFWRIIFDTGSTLSFDPLSGGDLNGHIYPIHSFLATSLQNGELPLWNPYMFCGFPQFAEMKTGVFYPLHWVLPLMVTDGYLSYRGNEIFSVFHAFLGSFYLSTRKLFVQKPRSSPFCLHSL